MGKPPKFWNYFTSNDHAIFFYAVFFLIAENKKQKIDLKNFKKSNITCFSRISAFIQRNAAKSFPEALNNNKKRLLAVYT